MKKHVLALLLLAALLMSLFSGCGSKPTDMAPADNSAAADESTGSKRNDVNIYCEGVWQSLDPYGPSCTTNTNMYLIYQVYECLVRVDDAGEVVPVLATDWTVDDSGTVYTFNLRQGVKFHNGEEMKASDVAYSFNRAMSEAALEPYYNYIDKVEASGDYVVTITLKDVFAPFVSYLKEFPIVSEKFASENELLTAECGTGPYVLESIDLNTEAVLTAFPDYWQGPASIQKATFKVITEATTAAVAFETGDLDVLFCYNVSSYAPLEETGKYNTQLVTANHTAVILLNNAVEPLNDKRVRQALSYATDRDTMIAVAYEGLALPTYLMANPYSFGLNEDQFYNHYEFNLEKAKELLAEAGYPDGLDLGDMTVIGNSYHEKYAQVWQQSLAQIGVTINIVSSESAVADTVNHDYITATMGETFTEDMAYTSNYYVMDNKCCYDNEEVADLYDEAAKELDPAKREELYAKIVDIIYDECPNIPIFNKEVPWVWDKNLTMTPHKDPGRQLYVYEMSWN